MQDPLIAYSLCQVEAGWIWRLIDEEGAIIAGGVAPDQRTAQQVMTQALEQTCELRAQ